MTGGPDPLAHPACRALPEEGACRWCAAPAPVEVVHVPGWTLAAAEEPGAWAAACPDCAALVVARVGPPRDEDPAWIDGTRPPLCPVCGRTAENPAFGGTALMRDVGGHLALVHEGCNRST